MDIIEPLFSVYPSRRVFPHKKTTRRSELSNNLIELDRLHKDAAELYKERSEY